MSENSQYLWHRRYQIKERALTNRLYYQERRRFFELRDNLINGLSIACGSAAFAYVGDPELIKLLAAIITLGNAISLVFGYQRKAQESLQFCAEWAQLERDIELVGERDFDEMQLNQWSSRANDIEANEPTAHRILLERCHRRAIVALGGEIEQPLSWLYRWLPIVTLP